MSNEFYAYLAEHGIHHQLTVAYTPQQNGVAERMNRTLMNLVRSMLHHKNIDKRFWAEALATAVYVRNRVTSRGLSANITPHHIWMGCAPNLEHLRAFGSRCWYVLPGHKVKKLDARAREAMLIGYSLASKAYKLWDVELKKVVISRSVTFDEDTGISVDVDTQGKNTGEEDEMPSAPAMEVKPQEKSSLPLDNISSGEHLPAEPNPEQPSDTLDRSESEPMTAIPILRRSARVSRPPRDFWIAPSHNAYIAIDSCNLASSKSLLAHDVPRSFKEAMSPHNIDQWGPAIEKEQSSITRNETWSYVERTSDMNVLPCMYVFTLKDSGPKARIGAKGCRQVHGVDYGETYAPVVKFTSIRIMLATVAIQDLELHQMDVVTAFLHGDLDKNIYMEVPGGFKDPSRPNLVCKLLKALYGLKQAPRLWHAKIDAFLIGELEFISSPNDPCLYVKHTAKALMINRALRGRLTDRRQ